MVSGRGLQNGQWEGAPECSVGGGSRMVSGRGLQNGQWEEAPEWSVGGGSRMVSFSCFTSGTYRVTLVTHPELSHEPGQDLNYNIQLSYPTHTISK
jgi:hypothetical protein